MSTRLSALLENESKETSRAASPLNSFGLRSETLYVTGGERGNTLQADMLTSEGMKNFGAASREDQRTILWTLARIQVELANYLAKLPGEPGDTATHDYVSRIAQVYIGSLLRELDDPHGVSA